MIEIVTLGRDLAKNVFQVHCIDRLLSDLGATLTQRPVGCVGVRQPTLPCKPPRRR